MKNLIYTIGHSNHNFERFASYLANYQIDCLVDVRSSPFSKLHPQYNQHELKWNLKERAIRYVHFGTEFGARFNDQSLLNEKGQVDFRKVQCSSEFQTGVERLKEGLRKNFRISLLCAEAEPLDCHRFAMISCQLTKESFEVRHIMRDGNTKTNEELERQLVHWYWQKIQVPLFNSEQYLEDYDVALRAAYSCKNAEIGYWPFGKQDEDQHND